MTSPKSRRPRRTRRSVSPFAMLHWYVLDSQGWHDLTLMARCAYLELSRRYDGANNGTIGMSARDLGKGLNRSSSHAAKALRELEDAGFITITKQGTFKRKNRLASEYRLNAFISDIDSDPPDRRWNNVRWDGVACNTVQWQNRALREPKTPSRCDQQRCQPLNDLSHSVACDTHIESTRGDGESDARSEVSVNSKPDAEGQKKGENNFGLSANDDHPLIAALGNWGVNAGKTKPPLKEAS